MTAAKNPEGAFGVQKSSSKSRAQEHPLKVAKSTNKDQKGEKPVANLDLLERFQKSSLFKKGEDNGASDR